MNLIPWRKRQNIPVARQSSFTAPAAEFRTELDHLFDRFFKNSWLAPSRWGEEFEGPALEFIPDIDVAENEKAITVRAEIPGMEPDDIDISISGNTLTIHGEKKESFEDKRDDFYHSECRYGSFTRSIELPSTADIDAIDAEVNNGVLKVCVKKLATAQPKKVNVKPHRQFAGANS